MGKFESNFVKRTIYLSHSMDFEINVFCEEHKVNRSIVIDALCFAYFWDDPKLLKALVERKSK